ncbi:major facilitator superfamily domain-containing protein [Boletus coccyginus]|nr:major facilitator superfamily domain-containing protein [Boletus coccyginus]
MLSTTRSKQPRQLQRNAHCGGGGVGGVRIVCPDTPSNVHVVADKAFFVRTLALLCACSLSIGSHYASYTLAPLKSRLSRELGTSNTEFSLLISALSLNGTWTPLIGGMLASKLGTTLTSILATGVVFLGQVLLLFGETQESVRLMTLGLFIYGLGLSPLAVVQESIIVRFFHSHGLGTSMAMGLVAGKSASFLSARTSYPLSVAFGRHAPFYVSTALTGFSFIINLVYVFISHWLIRGSGTTLEASEVHHEARRRAIYSISEAMALKKIAKKRRVSLKEVPLLGDVFWAYIGLNVLCGMLWSPFTHLAANMLEKRYDLNEATASMQASYLLIGSIVLYPTCGYLVDHINDPRAAIRMFMLSSLLTMFCYAWLVTPPRWTRTPLPGIIAFAGGVGFSPLLLVVIVPTIVPLKYVSTTLGVHKAVSATRHRDIRTVTSSHLTDGASAIQYLLCAFLFFNVLQLASLQGLTYLDKCRRGGQREPCSPEDLFFAPGSDSNASMHSHSEASDSTPMAERVPLLSQNDDIAWDPPHNVRRSHYTSLSALLICTAWVLFLGTAWLRLRSTEERGIRELQHM